ncbi:putative ABC transport system permease protein [Nocardioides sp. BE266]|uniref:ABC transporter permease n=1 Tax=Nocardioides sp. BE266 TaxID=2817725 RepID=UPI002866D15D|nr:FtsX-like permease family protein [Nocardioides sp. BE266]MDR7253267.1 putative ABC transport system permease protein [Nocardioides sp. BE266]
MSGWRPALLIAWRDALRHKGRSALVLVMISLPVLAVSAAAVIIKTSQVNGTEGVERVMGAADARIRTEGSGHVAQAPDPAGGLWSQLGDFDYDHPVTEQDLRTVLGADARLLPIHSGWSRARLGDRVIDFSTTGVDLSDPLTTGLFDLQTGHLPEQPGEVVVNQPMIDKGFAVGDDLDANGTRLTIVGVGRDATYRDSAVVIGSPDDLAGEGTNVREWLVDSGPVSWATVQKFNALGGVVTSRAVLADPPDVVAMAEQMGYDTGSNEMLAVVVLIVVMALIEVVLLAGPAFAVGARKHARTLALIAASGGTPRQSRRIILSSGLVLGAVASTVGLVLGIVTGWALLPLVQRFNGEWFGPFELPWLYLAAITAFGLVSALLASVVPAWLASRQDVVAVLAGRRGDRRPRPSTPVLGLVLLGAGIAASTYGAFTSDNGNGAFWIAGAAIVSVLGMILVVPVVVATVARSTGRWPLAARYAARDAARHRTRTVPAVAAVAATVAGVVALGIANASDQKQNEETYSPQAPMGSATLRWAPDVLVGEQAPDRAAVWDRIVDAVHGAAPDLDVALVRGVDDAYDPNGSTSTYLEPPDDLGAQVYGLVTYGPSIAVADDAAELGIEGEVAAEVDAALSEGIVVMLTPSSDARFEATLRQDTWREGDAEALDSSKQPVEVQALSWDEDTRGPAPSSTIVSAALAEGLGLEVVTVSASLTGDVDQKTETRIKEAVAGVADGSSLYVERGYQRPPEAVIILLVLAALGGVLMLGGTLTATFLALSDARPDLATLSAVGAAPRTRRRVAAAYALVIGFVGAILGAAVGFIPGVAISRPLTNFGDDGPFLAIPWLLVATIVLALPLLTAAVVGLSARSRLPLVARLD